MKIIAKKMVLWKSLGSAILALTLIGAVMVLLIPDGSGTVPGIVIAVLGVSIFLTLLFADAIRGKKGAIACNENGRIFIDKSAKVKIYKWSETNQPEEILFAKTVGLDEDDNYYILSFSDIAYIKLGNKDESASSKTAPIMFGMAGFGMAGYERSFKRLSSLQISLNDNKGFIVVKYLEKPEKVREELVRLKATL